MDKESMIKTALKEAQTAFKIACTIGNEERIEVYMENGQVKRSDVMGPKDEILYNDSRVLLYQIFGNDYLEDEIRAWIDQARGETDPQGLSLNIVEKIELMVKQSGRSPEMISSNEIFANLSFNVIEQIETAILDYWWDNEEEENGKSLAKQQISEALGA